MKHTLVAALLLTSTHVFGQAELTVEDKGTPVTYMVCSTFDRKCLVVARFIDMDSCEYHRQVEIKLCDRVSVPGQITCTTPKNSYANTLCLGNIE